MNRCSSNPSGKSRHSTISCSLHHRSTYLALVGLALFFSPLPIFLLLHAWYRTPPALVSLACLAMAIGIGCMMASLRLSLLWRQQLEAVLATGDCSGIGLVLEAMHGYHRWSCSAWVGETERRTQRRVCLHYTDALLTLLPRLQGEDFAFLTADQIDIMGKALYRTDTSLVLALLEALTRHGDARAMRMLQRFVGDKRFSGCQEQVRQAAQECLRTLEDRVQKQADPLFLLRASAASLSGQGSLLRAAPKGSETPVEELLRATTGTE